MRVDLLAHELVTDEVLGDDGLLRPAHRVEGSDTNGGGDLVLTEERQSVCLVFAVHLVRLDCHVEDSLVVGWILEKLVLSGQSLTKRPIPAIHLFHRLYSSLIFIFFISSRMLEM